MFNQFFRKRSPSNGRLSKQLLILLSALGAVILILTVVLIVVSVGSSGKSKDNQKLTDQIKSLTETADNDKKTADSRIAELEKELEETQKKLKQVLEDSGIQEDLLDRAEKLEEQLKIVTAERDSAKSENQDLSRKLTRLEKDISKLKADAERLSGDYLPTLFRQSDLFSQLTEAICAVPANADGSAPVFSIYFEDIDSGYSFTFRADEIWDGEAVSGLPLALAVLQKAAQENSSISLDTEFTYHTDKRQNGTGVIQNAADGTIYTHEQLFTLLLEQSDMTALRVLSDYYGTSQLKALIREEGWTSMNASVSRTSARDAAKVMIRLYEFSRDNAKYGDLVGNALTGSAYDQLSVKALPDQTVAHIYANGNGMYHEVALAQAEHPYVVSVMTDMEHATDAQKQALRRIIELLDALHTSYYTVNTK